VYKQLIYTAIFVSAIITAGLASLPSPVRAEDDNCDLPGKSHGDNNPSSNKFKHMAYSANLCEIAVCVDDEKCANQVKVDWEKFQNSPAYEDAEHDEQKALQKWHSDGNGADGLVGYEILQIMQGHY
jgi:hypothetical protein